MTRRAPPRPTPVRTDTISSALRIIPPRWALAILAVAISYALLQPTLNQWLGWRLPSIPSLLGQSSQPHVAPDSESPAKPPGKPPANETSNASPKDLKFGFLTDIGRDRFQSPAGLIYAPGSEEGHRLKHIERHLKNDPKRPGPHGVFEGDMQDFLKAIDETYRLARGHAKGSKQSTEAGSTVYEAQFGKPIGFLGGTLGAQRGHPKLQRMRIVVRNENIITGFPIQ